MRRQRQRCFTHRHEEVPAAIQGCRGLDGLIALEQMAVVNLEFLLSCAGLIIFPQMRLSIPRVHMLRDWPVLSFPSSVPA